MGEKLGSDVPKKPTRKLESSESRTVKIEFDEGVAVGKITAETEFRLDGFYVKQRFRNKGHGRQNYLELENSLKEKGIKTIYIQALHNKKEFWKKLGFETYQALDPANVERRKIFFMKKDV